MFQKTTCPSLQFSMALQPIQKDMAHSMLIHESGWCSKTHLEVQMFSQSNSSSTHLLTTLKGLIISVASSQSASSSQAASFSQAASSSQSSLTIQSASHHKMFCPEHSQASAQGAPCMFTPLFLYGIFPHTLIFFPKPQTTQTGDCNKFSLLNSPYAPYPIPAWSAALQAVDQSPFHLVEISKSMQSYGHYTFPDPGLFIYPATAAKHIESWLQVCDAWFMHVAKEPFFALSNQSWHTFLSIDNTMPEKRETKAAHCHQEVLDIILSTSNMYPGVEKQSGSMGPIVWQGREYPSGVLLSEDIV